MFVSTHVGGRWNTLALSYSDGCKQGNAETSAYCSRKRRNCCGSMRLWFHLNPYTPGPAPKQAPPLYPDNAFESSRVKDYRLFYETLAYVAKTMYQKTQCDIITNLTVDPVRLQCFHRDLNVSIHDRICLRLSQ